MTPAEYVRRSRERQGLPPVPKPDPETARKLAAILRRAEKGRAA